MVHNYYREIDLNVGRRSMSQPSSISCRLGGVTCESVTDGTAAERPSRPPGRGPWGGSAQTPGHKTRRALPGFSYSRVCQAG
jgi:hypothetical protein